MENNPVVKFLDSKGFTNIKRQEYINENRVVYSALNKNRK